MIERTPLFLLPGLLCDAALWARQVAELSDVADCHVADMTQDDSIAGMAKRVLDAAPERFALAGLSMGGYCAFEIMRMAPERVVRLALLDTSAEPDTPERTAARRDLVATAGVGTAGFSTVVEGHLQTFVHPDRLDDAPLMNTIRASAHNVGAEAYLRQQSAIIDRRDQRSSLGDISCPTLVLVGRDDALTPLALHESIAAGISGARLEVIDDCGHLTTLERPDAVNAALRTWLED
ncbi:MAG: alpha/beta fold hydrolase [Rhodospirillaceae bacterium]|nr:alpha/beta fold hydrolase [Rhodospirillaceae bacterium]